MSGIVYKANVFDKCENNYHWEVSLFEDDVVIEYVEKGRTPQEYDTYHINPDAAVNVAKAILKLAELAKESK